MNKNIPITHGQTSDIVLRDLRLEALESIAESLKSIDKSLQKISGEKTEKIPGPVKKSYAERYFTYDGRKVKEKEHDNETD